VADNINASLLIQSFDPTGNPGEYSFSSAITDIQYDPQGIGAGNILVGYVVYVPASDANTGIPIPGSVHRYALTSVTLLDQETISGTLIWDEVGPEYDTPTNGSYCLVGPTSSNLDLGYPPIDSMFPELTPGSTIASLYTDLKNIVDYITYIKSSTFTGKFSTTDWVNNSDNTATLTISHGLNSTTLLVCCWQQTDTILQMVPLNPTVIDDMSIKFTVIKTAVFSGQVTVAVATAPLI